MRVLYIQFYPPNGSYLARDQISVFPNNFWRESAISFSANQPLGNVAAMLTVLVPNYVTFGCVGDVTRYYISPKTRIFLNC